MNVLKWLSGKLLAFAVTMFFVTLFTFGVMKMAPGTPYASERKVSPIVEQMIRERMHLDEPWPVQYGYYVGSVLGLTKPLPSLRYEDKTPWEIIFPPLRDQRTGQWRIFYFDENDEVWKIVPMGGIWASVLLGLLALAFALALGVVSGVVAAEYRNTPADYTVIGAALIGIAVPNIVVGPLLSHWFGLKLELLPVSGWGELRHLALPGFTLGLIYAAYFARMGRGGMLEVNHEDFVRTARAKGLPPWLIVVRHKLKLGLLPVVTFLGPATSEILVGSVVVEQIFQIPGIGRYTVEAALNRDYTLLMNMVVVIFTFMYWANAVVDLIYRFIDPRTRGKEAV